MIMRISFTTLTIAAWLFFLAYWLWSARRVKRPIRAEPALPRFFKYWLPIIVAIALMWPTAWFENSLLGRRFVPDAYWPALLGVLLTVAGVLFACWARHILGSNWSSEVQLKQDHELIERGPYRLVRHPIYTGILLGLLGTALLLGEWRALLGFAIMFVSFWRKLRLEETWLSEYFGPKYGEYMQRVKALIPGVL
jgi:protein-S-isoprenylcysteine O-methyltransferase Ste14